jgi:hypothetical protein
VVSVASLADEGYGPEYSKWENQMPRKSWNLEAKMEKRGRELRSRQLSNSIEL